MIFFGILFSIAAIAFYCWLLFTLAAFALPLFVGIGAGVSAYHRGAGWFGAMVVALIAAALTLGLGHFLLATVRPVWAQLVVATAFVAPAAIVGYHATHGIMKYAMPSETWQIAFSVVGAIAVGVAAFARVVGVAPAGSRGSAEVRA